MIDALERDPWLRTGVSIGVIPLYLLLTHLLAGVVYRAMSVEFTLGGRIAAAIVWAALGAAIVGAFSWFVTWRSHDGRPALHWWIAPVVGVVALVELIVIIVAIAVPHGEADLSWGAAVLEQVASARFWAVSLWMPLTVWICLGATIHIRRSRPPRMVLIGVVPYVLAGVVFIGLLNGGVYGGAEL